MSSRRLRALFPVGIMAGLLLLAAGCGDAHDKGRPDPLNDPAPPVKLGPKDPKDAAPPTPTSALWGTIEGRAMWAAAAAPAPVIANVNKDQMQCLKNGPILAQDYVVNPNNKGVRWVVVWLVDADDFAKPLPIHQDLKEVKEKKVVLDQPCCQFEPHVVCLREGQDLEVKNSGTVPHNTKIDSPGDNPSVNPLIPVGASVSVPGWKAATSPSTVSCSIHGWMTAWIRVFNHPYFAVTDEDGTFKIEKAPVGKYHIVAWQESVGYLSKTYKKGDPIDVKADGVTEVNFQVKPPE